MQIKLDDIEMIAAIVGAAVSIVVAILGGVWRLLGSFRETMLDHLSAVDMGLEDRQEAWRKMLESHIHAETVEFEALHELRREMSLIRQDLEAGYPTRREMQERLDSMMKTIEEIREIVEARKASGNDPASGRPIEGDRRMAEQRGEKGGD